MHVLDSQSGKRFGIDDDSRYAMASTFKLPLAAALLWQVDRKRIHARTRAADRTRRPVAESPAVEAELAAGARR